ncbi:MAG: nodulation protein NodZ, partial [Deltaproteobacteria bacterium]|nr:nodulation protein NodZ [Deltaproteobacteria bacterium]
MSDEKYVLCVPREGFNDVLCQMETAWDYAARHGRILVVDARHSALEDSFAQYFATKDTRVLLHPGEALLRHFDGLDVYPPFLRGRVSRHAREVVDVQNDDGILVKVDADACRPLTFDMSRPYREELLVHHAHGGSCRGLVCLQKLKLLPEIALRIVRRLADLGEDYDAVHIRNTDIGTDYLPFFR